MTNDEAYTFGWVYGYLTKAGAKTSIPFEIACARPYMASAGIVANASIKHLLTPDRQKALADAFSRITSMADTDKSGAEKTQSLPMQGTWQMGYYRGLGGQPLPPASKTFDIAERRKAKGMTQAQLASAMGVLQSNVSRWESGVVTPNNDTLDRLHKILD